jgi:hypothetical protein
MLNPATGTDGKESKAVALPVEVKLADVDPKAFGESLN